MGALLGGGWGVVDVTPHGLLKALAARTISSLKLVVFTPEARVKARVMMTGSGIVVANCAHHPETLVP